MKKGSLREWFETEWLEQSSFLSDYIWLLTKSHHSLANQYQKHIAVLATSIKESGLAADLCYIGYAAYVISREQGVAFPECYNTLAEWLGQPTESAAILTNLQATLSNITPQDTNAAWHKYPDSIWPGHYSLRQVHDVLAALGVSPNLRLQ